MRYSIFSNINKIQFPDDNDHSTYYWDSLSETRHDLNVWKLSRTFPLRGQYHDIFSSNFFANPTHRYLTNKFILPLKVTPIEKIIYTDAKAKIDASTQKFIQLLATLSILPRSIWKNRTNSTFSSVRPR